MNPGLVCPLCGDFPPQPILGSVKISVDVDGTLLSGDVLAYRCRDVGHVFFLRRYDLYAIPGDQETMPAA
jgi:hypothetical protein